jgi:Cdc6-like AAA superfamily ATPase
MAVNRLLMRVTRRAEKATPEYLARTFVPVEPVPSLLESLDNQVIYGRRGTGKTHLLKYLAETKKQGNWSGAGIGRG